MPKNINTDNEYDTIEFNKWANTNDITVWFSDPDEINKNAIIERFHRTLALMIQRYRLSEKKNDWHKVLKSLIDNYNHTKHRTTKHNPYDIYHGIRTNDQEINVVGTTFKVGDKVRVKRKKTVFEKADVLKYSTDVYLIVAQIKKKFQLLNINKNIHIKKLYKDYELKLANIIQTKSQVEPIVAKIDTERKARKAKKDLKAEGIETKNVIKKKLRKIAPTKVIRKKRIPKKPQGKQLKKTIVAPKKIDEEINNMWIHLDEAQD